MKNVKYVKYLAWFKQQYPLIYQYFLYTVITRKQWNRKTTLYQYLSAFEVVTKQIVLLHTF